MSQYLIEVYTPDGELVADISGLCRQRYFQVRRNRPEDIRLSLNLHEAQDLSRSLNLSFAQLFTEGVNEVRITRGNRALVGGQIAYAFPKLDTEGATLELRAVGFLELFAKRYLAPSDTLTYTTTDIGQIAWNFINQTQSKTDGDWGITQGTLQTSRDITDTWEPYGSSIKEILIGLTERINGIDFEFTPDKQFNVYYPGIGSDKSELLFSYPGNITAIGFPRDATTLVNTSVNRGSGNGDVQLIETRTDSASQSTYKLRERIDDYPSVSVTQTLDDKGDETLRLFASPTSIPEVTLDGNKEPFLGSYWLGDRVRYTVEGYPAFAAINNQTWRINEITVDVDENDHENIQQKVGYA